MNFPTFRVFEESRHLIRPRDYLEVFEGKPVPAKVIDSRHEVIQGRPQGGEGERVVVEEPQDLRGKRAKRYTHKRQTF